jgi:nucleoid DNA-binding protein
MTKADLIESIAGKLDLPKGQAERAVNTIFDDIVAALERRQGQHRGSGRSWSRRGAHGT